MRTLLAATLLAAAPLLGLAEPMGFQEFVLGEDLQAQADAAGLFCMPGAHEVVTCGTVSRAALSSRAQTIAGAPVEKVYFIGAAGRLGHISVQFPADQFDHVLASYRDRYPDLACTDTLVANRLGTRFDQVRCTLRTADGSLLELDKRTDRLDLAEVTMTNAAMIRVFGRTAEHGREKARKAI